MCDSTGLGAGLFTDEELGRGPSDEAPAKSAKIQFLIKLIGWLRFATGERLDVFISPAK